MASLLGSTFETFNGYEATYRLVLRRMSPAQSLMVQYVSIELWLELVILASDELPPKVVFNCASVATTSILGQLYFATWGGVAVRKQ